MIELKYSEINPTWLIIAPNEKERMQINAMIEQVWAILNGWA